MQRLVLAILIVAVLAAVLAVLIAGLRRALAPGPLPAATGADGMQKLAFALLIALMAYAALAGSG